MTDALTVAIEAIFEEIEATTDPVERFRKGRELRATIAESDQRVIRMEQAVVDELKHGRTWAEVGVLLGLTGSRAEQIAKGR